MWAHGRTRCTGEGPAGARPVDAGDAALPERGEAQRHQSHSDLLIWDPWPPELRATKFSFKPRFGPVVLLSQLPANSYQHFDTSAF